MKGCALDGLMHPAVLASVAGPVAVLGRGGRFPGATTRVLTWGGLRGGISVALALTIPTVVADQPVPERDPLLALTYVVVVFSILVQGLTLGPLARSWLTAPGQTHPPETRPHSRAAGPARPGGS